jgi:hypothetical protein
MVKTQPPKKGEKLPKGVPATDLPTKKGTKNTSTPYQKKSSSRKK